MNDNLHEELSDPVQRFLNAMEPGTYVRPHRHIDPERWEAFIALSGEVALLTFDELGVVTDRVEISAEGPIKGIEIDPGVWHTVVALQAGTVMFELKQGPYSKMSDKCFAEWAPKEKDGQVSEIVDWYKSAQTGDQFTSP